ncbi:MAG: 23S rRNA (guanosine(2251)-2'-O)-methyltransferase RlmB [Bacteroidota bacterium]|nr:23S rRNA (guanosine(2251)-2'-O)-methyltransferase RlmB [Bacteroidota bacterium]
MQSKEKIYGINPVLEALKEGTSLNKVFIQKDMHNDRIKDIINLLKKQEIPFQFVPKEKLNRLTNKNHQGVVAMGSEVDFLSVENLLPQIFESGETPFLLVLDGVTDVRNFGAIARSAECFGAHALVAPASGSAMINAEAVKASAGALHKVHICRELNFQKAINTIKNSGLQMIACTEKSEKYIGEADLTLPTALVMGSEGFGIDENLLAQCDVLTRIPMAGDIQSLNVSVAAGIALYEMLRQRGNM